MCYMYYIAADRPLPTVSGDARFPELRVEEARADTARLVRSLAHRSAVYIAFSYQGCGCGFSYEDRAELEATLADIPDEETCANSREDWEAGEQSVSSLRRYLAEQVAEGPVSLYIAWAGSEGEPLRSRATVTPAYFGGPSFAAPGEGALLTVVGAGAAHL